MIKQGITFLFLLATLASSAQTINLKDNVDCYGTAVQTISRTSSSGTPTRNIFTGTLNFSGFPEPNRVIWTGSRWEIQSSPDGGFSWDLVYSNTYASHPNPPRLGTGTWVADPALSCGPLAQFNGDGTQTSLTVPVELMSFSAQNTTDGKTVLVWATASETQNEGFEVERSTNGTRFEKIGFVPGKGTSATIQFYSFDDNTPGTGTSYYRLKQIDYGGSFEYSKVAAVRQEGKNILSVFPNPTKDGILIVTGLENTENEEFTVVNSVGQTMSATVQNDGQLDLSTYPSGVYYLRVTSTGSIIKIVKE